ncbi:hypothetical protein A7A08_01890 [Methyloligella halotolerans]|uniref:PepSY domain-containing protein n=1 Tax=Methyloligella halotolerans TaxID=1177755 RepID=A0A1E2RY44_9HYPH|nr:PepSY domain-containing protein [Methyloligella halotolerans]ODA67144.1 hypothetical protein A7A08_01890 [Methyloligella halotolerans]
MRKTAIALAVLGAFAVATPAMADPVNRLNVPADKWMSPAELKSSLKDQGYDVREIETDDGAYEVEMTDKDGTRIEAYVHPETGEILKNYDD